MTIPRKPQIRALINIAFGMTQLAVTILMAKSSPIVAKTPNLIKPAKYGCIVVKLTKPARVTGTTSIATTAAMTKPQIKSPFLKLKTPHIFYF